MQLLMLNQNNYVEKHPKTSLPPGFCCREERPPCGATVHARRADAGGLRLPSAGSHTRTASALSSSRQLQYSNYLIGVKHRPQTLVMETEEATSLTFFWPIFH